MKPSDTEIAAKAKEFAKQDRVAEERAEAPINSADVTPPTDSAERIDYLTRAELETLREQEQ
jgi:hypothetical protein